MPRWKGCVMGQLVMRDLMAALRLKWRRRIAAAFQAHHQRQADEAMQALHYHTSRAKAWQAETRTLEDEVRNGRQQPAKGDRDGTREDSIR